jgi:hypothetical protein
MQFVLTVTMDNDAFTPDPARELRRILALVPANVGYGRLGVGDSGALHDLNGNRVGAWHVQAEAGR